jgi:AcrR family transcriptional regulator
MAPLKTLAKPMRMPVQVRSAHTVEAIFQATIQVLVHAGLHKLTTTKVADRAGVSVGTLYQYFPNKNVLLSAALDRHLNAIVTAVETACLAAKGQPVKIMAATLVGAFVDAKLKHPEASKALYAVASELGSADVVARMTQRSQLALCDVLATAADAEFSDLRVVSYVLSTALVGPVQGLLQADMPPAFVEDVKQQLTLMTSAYLRECGDGGMATSRSLGSTNAVLRSR